MIDLSNPAATIEYLLGLPSETDSIEFKRVTGSNLGRVAQSVCALANKDGGWVVLGLGDVARASGRVPSKFDRVFGIEDNPEAFDQWKRDLIKRFEPRIQLTYHELPCTLRNDAPGHLCLVKVPASEHVHSIVDGGTWMRGDASNRQLSAEDTALLSLRRGVRSAESDLVPVPLQLLSTPTWESFLQSRRLLEGTLEERLMRIGLAGVGPDGATVQPLRAAVLLFAEDPGSLLAAQGTRADIRIFVYSGTEIGTDQDPNIRKRMSLRGPLISLIDQAKTVVLNELAQGIVRSGSGFRTVHKYPERVITEAIVNAVIHRDYRLNRDIVLRILEDRVIVEVPGTFMGRITPTNISTTGSKARNPLIAKHLSAFPVPPNFDDGEGVRMMFDQMLKADLYPPKYRVVEDAAVEYVELTLFNEERPEAWTEVSDWIDKNGPIGNAALCKIAGVDTLRASKMLRNWVERGFLRPLPDRGRRNAAYEKGGDQ